MVGIFRAWVRWLLTFSYIKSIYIVLNFNQLLKNPDGLRALTWQQLNDALRRFPYAQGLHLLAARKAQLEDLPDAKKYIEKAATYVPNRRYLFQFIQETQLETATIEVAPIVVAAPETPKIVMQTEPILVENIADVETENTPIIVVNEAVAPIITTEMPVVINENIVENIDNNIVEINENINENVDENVATETNEIAPIINHIHEQEPLEVVSEIAEIVAPIEVQNEAETQAIVTPEIVAKEVVQEEEEEIFAPEIAPSPVTFVGSASMIASFGDWLLHLNGTPAAKPVVAVAEPEPEPAEIDEDDFEALENAVHEAKVAQLARNSIAESDHIISETLAKILVAQGKYKKAIKMYLQLSAKFPEKNITFAQQIEIIKKESETAH